MISNLKNAAEVDALGSYGPELLGNASIDFEAISQTKWLTYHLEDEGDTNTVTLIQLGAKNYANAAVLILHMTAETARSFRPETVMLGQIVRNILEKSAEAGDLNLESNKKNVTTLSL